MPSLYNADHIALYDVAMVGFAESAELLASQIPDSLQVTSYLDIGCGTGLTAQTYVHQLIRTKLQTKSFNPFNVMLIDGQDEMVKRAVRKVMDIKGKTALIDKVGWEVEDVAGQMLYLESDPLVRTPFSHYSTAGLTQHPFRTAGTTAQVVGQVFARVGLPPRRRCPPSARHLNTLHQPRSH